MNSTAKNIQLSSKKTYVSPSIEQVKLDTEISLVMTSTPSFPTEPGGEPGIGGLVKIKRILRA
jgi:hypothetical protein